MNFTYRCDCNKMLVDQPTPTDKNIKCPKCGKLHMWFKDNYREYEIATLLDSFTPRLVSGLGLHNKLRRGLIKCKMKD